MRARWITAIAAGVVLIVGGSSVVASAASVGPVASRLFAASAPVTYTAADRQVTDVARTTSGSPAAITALSITVAGPTLTGLSGQAVSVVLVDSSNAVVTTVSGTITTGTGGNTVVGASSAIISLPVTGSPSATTVTGWATFIAGVQVLGPTTATPRAVTIGNGTFPVTTWQAGVVPPASATNATVNSVTPTTNTTVQVCLTISVTGTSPTPTAWSLKLDFSQPPYYGITPSQVANAQVQSTTGSVWTIVGNSNGGGWTATQNNALLTSSQTIAIVVCQYSAGIAPNRTEAYTTSGSSVLTVSTNLGGNAKACESVTVTGNGTYPFYFGWLVPVNMSAAIAYLRAIDPSAPRSMSYTPDVVSPGFAGATSTYAVSNYRDDAIAGSGSQVVTLCLNQY